MNTRRIISAVVILLGAGLLYFSSSIAEQVALGKVQIEEGQQKVDTINSLFSKTKYTKPVGEQLTGSGQRRINAGQAEVEKYEKLSNELEVAGIVLMCMGAGLFFFWTRKTK